MIEDNDAETVVYKVDVFNVILQTREGVIVTAECSCDSDTSEVIVEDLFGYSRESSSLCQHSEEAIITHYSRFEEDVKNTVVKIK